VTVGDVSRLKDEDGEEELIAERSVRDCSVCSGFWIKDCARGKVKILFYDFVSGMNASGDCSSF